MMSGYDVHLDLDDFQGSASSSSQTSQIEEGGTRSSSDLWSDICRYPNKFPCTSTEFKIKWAPSSLVALSSSAPEELMEIDITRRDQMELDDQRVGVGPIDQELEPRSPNHNSPVSVQPAQDGSKMEAHTPHGTRISTPLNSRPPSALGGKPSSMAAVGSTSCSSRPLYTAAVKSEPKDWHLAFSLGGQSIPLDTTVYGARQNVRISWQKILESLIYKVFELYSSCWAMLEQQYMMWCNHDSDGQSLHIFSQNGLFPSPMDKRSSQSGRGIESLLKFKVLGQFMAKALMDSQILPLTIASVMLHLSKYVVKKQAIEADGGLTESERDGAIRQIRVDGAKVEDLAVEFVLPGYDIEMKPDGTETVVTIDNVKEFIDLLQQIMPSSSMITMNQLMKQNNISMVS
ncbi:hypothetical protein PPACK8108_LOCUS22737 [Phakopsora pachyrhizi]|uniref:HECT domain-containing protein n=1 Tax=Phakopsora pachyrhizi TaxID=170000 RepID=A0AAV0BND0_PHAPC|nr:hypothetical protein PPACK8108_LOCUS22737 [Phakopsora pachyrhizi]